MNSQFLRLYTARGLLDEKIAEKIDKLTADDVSARDMAIKNQYFTEKEELPVLSEYYGLSYSELDSLDIDESLADRFSYELMKKHSFIPVSIGIDGVLTVAVGKPVSPYTSAVLASSFACDYRFVLVAESEIEAYVESAAATARTTGAIRELKEEAAGHSAARLRTDRGSLNDADSVNNPAVRLVDSIIKEAIPHRASDIHIEPFDTCVKVRYRIDGDLRERAEFPRESYSAVCARLKIVAGMDIAERRVPQDGRINMNVGGVEYDFRVSTLPTVHGEKFVIRILDKTSFGYHRSDLGFTERENILVDKMLAHPHGIILLTGPTGCGKSTTLYSFLSEYNDPSVNIVTVEDPVEFKLPGINQTEVNAKANLTFATVLRSILRQDPDIIMIGEIRDEETAQIAVRSAITGHIVFSTLHTNDAPGAFVRLTDMGVEDYLVADALVGVIAQRLVKKLCPHCKKAVQTTSAEMKLLGITEPKTVYVPCGCRHCDGAGYRGRVAAHEIMYVNDAMRLAFCKEKNIDALRRLAVENGMVPLAGAVRELVYDGVTSIAELLKLHVE